MSNCLNSTIPDRFSLFHRRDKWLAYGEVLDGIWFGRMISAEQLRQAYMEAGTLKGFAEKYALTPTTARTVLEAHGLSFEAILAEEWNAGPSLQKLSERHGPKSDTLGKWLKKAGYEIPAGNHRKGVDTEMLKEIVNKTSSINRAANAFGIHWKTAKRMNDQKSPENAQTSRED